MIEILRMNYMMKVKSGFTFILSEMEVTYYCHMVKKKNGSFFCLRNSLLWALWMPKVQTDAKKA